MGRSIHDLVAQAISLRAAASPVRANILDILAALQDDDLTIISQCVHLSGDRQREVAGKLGLSQQIVYGSLDKLIRLDLANDADAIAKCKEYYLASGCSETKVVRLLKDGFSEEAVYFVLHCLIHRWAYTRSTYPLIGLGIEDDKVSRLCTGYLASIGFAFETRVDLLGYSFESEWPNWQLLWQYY
jgi:hypothetical protein